MLKKIFLLSAFFSTTVFGMASPRGPEAFADLDAYFVQQFNKITKTFGENYFPILVINGFDYILLKDKSSQESFVSNISPFNELKAVAHIGPGLFAIGEESWRRPDKFDWKPLFKTYHKKIQACIRSVSAVDWANAAWPNKSEEIKRFVGNSLKKTELFLETILKKGSYTQDDYEQFVKAYLPTMLVCLYFADLADTENVLSHLKKWKSDLGEKSWDKLFVVIIGSEGSPTRGWTLETSQEAIKVASLMKPDLVKSHILFSQKSNTIEEARLVLGSTLAPRKLAETVFSTPELRAMNPSQLYSSLKQQTNMLAYPDVEMIVETLKKRHLIHPFLQAQSVTKPSNTNSSAKPQQ